MGKFQLGGGLLKLSGYFHLLIKQTINFFFIKFKNKPVIEMLLAYVWVKVYFFFIFFTGCVDSYNQLS